jgi:hypothetical protein
MTERRLLSAEERSGALISVMADVPRRLKVLEYARRQSRKTGREASELINEAVVRILSGQREWWSDIPAGVLVTGVIRSIASQWWEQKVRSANELVELRHLEERGNREEGVTAEVETMGMYTDIMNTLSDDPVAQKLFVGIFEGMKGEELRKHLTLIP